MQIDQLSQILASEEVHPLNPKKSDCLVGQMASNTLDGTAVAILADVRERILGWLVDEKRESIKEEEALSLIDESAERFGLSLAAFERDQIATHIMSESRSFGVLQPLIDDESISDIIVHHYSKIVVQCGRRTIRTDYRFADQRYYETFVEHLLHRASASYSTKKPIADGMIGSQLRIHAVHRSLCETGPYLTIRINRMPRVTSEHLIAHGFAPSPVFDYLRKLVKIGVSIFIVGEVGTGKTTLVRALASAMPEHESILVIEDTPEIQLEHPHVRAMTTREVNTDGAGRISPSECIRAGMRMAMNRIIFGEIRDAEAAEAFVDVCASGHPGISTIHGRSAEESLTRLELFLGRAQRGVSHHVIAEQITTAIQAIVSVGICPINGKRRILEVREIGPVADGKIRYREIFRYIPGMCAEWRVVTRSSAHQEAIENGESAVRLSNLPPHLRCSAAGVGNA